MSRASTILEAVRLTSNADIEALHKHLQTSPKLKIDHVLRILLTYLPASTDPHLYIDFLKRLWTDQIGLTHALRNTGSSVTTQNEAQARSKVRQLKLRPLVASSPLIADQTDFLTLYLLLQARNIEDETGSLQTVVWLLDPFVNHSEELRKWMISTLLPLHRIGYEYYDKSAPSYSMGNLEDMEARMAVRSLLAKARQADSDGNLHADRDIRGLVGPWMYGESSRKRRRLQDPTISVEDKMAQEHASDWSYVNEWLLGLANTDFSVATQCIKAWDGPADIDYGQWRKSQNGHADQIPTEAISRYAQTGLALLYTTKAASMQSLIESQQVLQRVARLTSLEEVPELQKMDGLISSEPKEEYLAALSDADLHYASLLHFQNNLTYPSNDSITLLNLILANSKKLLNLGSIHSTSSIAKIVLFGDRSQQLAELTKVLQHLRNDRIDDDAWISARQQILWLHDWSGSKDEQSTRRGFFSQIPLEELETHILAAMLDTGSYDLIATIYCQNHSPVKVDQVESIIVAAAFAAYDSASNGNRSRGGVRKASDIVKTLGSAFPRSRRFSQLSALIMATHAMSFYSLTLQHGVPFQPVSIRAYKDPMQLIGKILDQNPRSYTHLDDFLDIGQNLITAGLGWDSTGDDEKSLIDMEEKEKEIARRRVTKMAIEAALEEHDFETAYSYVVNRISTYAQGAERGIEGGKEISERVRGPILYDDISWRAAFAVGRYAARESGSGALRHIEQRMEVLSQALLLAPPSALADVLEVWRGCEAQMNDALEAVAEEEAEAAIIAGQTLPGGFAEDTHDLNGRARDARKGALLEEAPMSLFDVTRGAAAALRNNAFSLPGSQSKLKSPTRTSQGRPLSIASTGDVSDGSAGRYDGTERMRKRDMVSNLVTGGLASGIGWVIGAPPVQHEP